MFWPFFDGNTCCVDIASGRAGGEPIVATLFYFFCLRVAECVFPIHDTSHVLLSIGPIAANLNTSLYRVRYEHVFWGGMPTRPHLALHIYIYILDVLYVGY